MAIDYNIITEADGTLRIHGGVLSDNIGVVIGPSGYPVDTDVTKNYRFYIMSKQGVEYNNTPGSHVSHFLETGYEEGYTTSADGPDIVDNMESHYPGWSDLVYLNHYIEYYKSQLPTSADIVINSIVDSSSVETGIIVKVKANNPVIKTENNPTTKHDGVVVKREG